MRHRYRFPPPPRLQVPLLLAPRPHSLAPLALDPLVEMMVVLLAGQFRSVGMKTSPLTHLGLLPLAAALWSLVMEMKTAPLSHLSLLLLARVL